MRITIDTELERVIVPNSFYSQIDKMNEVLEKAGAAEKKIKYETFVEDAVNKALSNPYIRKDDLRTFKK